MDIKIIRSRRRTRTIGGRVQGDVLIVRAPATMSDAELAPYIEGFKKKLEAQRRRLEAKSDAGLMARAQTLNRRYFDGKLRIVSVRFVANQKKRFGSCSTDQGAIRLSDRLARMPAWVLDYVLMHELAHLVEPNHSARFWKLVNRFPRAERARGYLMAVGMESDVGEGEGGEDPEG